MDGQIVAIIVGSAAFTGISGTLLWKLVSRIGNLEGKLNGMNPEAFGRVEGKVDGLDKRMHSYELQLNDFGKGISRLDRRINGFLDDFLKERGNK